MSSPAPVCPSIPPEGKAVPAAPCLDRQTSSIPAWIAAIQQQPFVGAKWCWCPRAPLPPCHNLQPAGIRQGLFRGGQACRARPCRAACPLPPRTDPAAQHWRRSGGEHVGGHSIQRHRQDQSEYLPPTHPADCWVEDSRKRHPGVPSCHPAAVCVQSGLCSPTSTSVSQATSRSSSSALEHDHIVIKHSQPRMESRRHRATRSC